MRDCRGSSINQGPPGPGFTGAIGGDGGMQLLPLRAKKKWEICILPIVMFLRMLRPDGSLPVALARGNLAWRPMVWKAPLRSFYATLLKYLGDSGRIVNAAGLGFAFPPTTRAVSAPKMVRVTRRGPPRTILWTFLDVARPASWTEFGGTRFAVLGRRKFRRHIPLMSARKFRKKKFPVAITQKSNYHSRPPNY